MDAQRAVSVLAFRGTELILGDWITILRARQVAWAEGGRVHGGFADGLAAVWSDLAPRLAAAPGRRLYTGHSLGAALATLAATRERPHALYTYGSPRVGDDAFLRTLGAGVAPVHELLRRGLSPAAASVRVPAPRALVLSGPGGSGAPSARTGPRETRSLPGETHVPVALGLAATARLDA